MALMRAARMSVAEADFEDADALKAMHDAQRCTC